MTWPKPAWLQALLGVIARLRTQPRRADAPRPDLADAPLDVLATKIMFSHLRNRQQLLGPPPTAFGQLDQGQTELLIRAAIAAAMADGSFTEERERVLRGTLSAYSLQVEEHGFVAGAIKRPAPVETLLREVRDPHVASLFYAASLLATDKRDPVSRAYLQYVAARLRLTSEELARLHSQHGFEDTPVPG